MITLSTAFEQFSTEIEPAVIAQYGEDDQIALNEAWNNYTDSLCKDREITDLQYHYCPSLDDVHELEEDLESELEWLLDKLGISVEYCVASARPDGLMPTIAHHYTFTISRPGDPGAQPITGHWSCGSACYPSAGSIFESVCRDAQMVEYHENWQDMAIELGYTDTAENLQRAEVAYTACQVFKNQLDNMLTGQEWESIEQIIQEL